LEQRTGIAFHKAKNHFEAQGGKDAVVEASGHLKTIAVSLFKIANDIRWLGSGPRCGIGEIQLPATQPGSSIMPGKVNPVMCESLMMVCAQVIGHDGAITWAGANGNFELNVMMPVMAYDLLESIRLLANAVDIFCDKCVIGILANKNRCEELVELSMAMVTSLAPKIGYDRAAEIAKESAATGRTVREICRQKKILPEAELNCALDPIAMTEAGGERAANGERRAKNSREFVNVPRSVFPGSTYGRQRQWTPILGRREHRAQMPESHLRANGRLLSRYAGVAVDRGRRRWLHFPIWS